MPVVKVRGPTRENRPFTGRVIQIQARNIYNKYSVHEDLLCATSKLSKTLLQKRWDWGACAICLDVLDPAIADIAFHQMHCDGHSVHQDCIDAWKAMNPEASSCSMCEAIQVSLPSIVSLPSEIDLDPKAVQLYIDWLYADTIRVDPDVAVESDDYNVCLLRAWSVASAAQDKDFKHALIAHLVSQFDEQKNAGFGATSITYAFETTEHQSMRKFIWKYCIGVGMTESVKQATGGVVKAFHDEVHNTVMETLRGSMFERGG
jgi:hypothetical protein